MPAGVDVQDGRSPYLLLGWEARLLPYIDQAPLWRATERAFQTTTAVDQNPPHVGLSTVVPLYVCPADDRVRDAQKTPPDGLEVAFTSYLGVAGVESLAEDGVLYADSSVRFSEVTDGMSNTLMVGERPPSADLRFGWWYAGSGLGWSGVCDMVLGVRELNTYFTYFGTCAGGPFDFAPGALGNQCDMFHYWSLHPGGANFLFVDGSVHFLTYSAAPLMPSLATRAGGEPVETP